MTDNVIAIPVQNLFDSVANPPDWLRWQSGFLEKSQDLGMGRKSFPFANSQRVKNGAKRPFGDDSRVKLFERARGGIAGIWKGRFSGRFKFGIKFFEILDGNKSLSANLQQFRRIFKLQFQRNRPDRSDIGCDIVAHFSVAPGDAHGQPAVLGR